MDRQFEFEQVKQLRSLLTQVKSKISENSKAGYLKKYAHLLKSCQSPEQISSTPGSYYAYRAALIFCTAEEARQALKIRDKAAFGSPEWQSAMDKIMVCLSRFERYPPDHGRKHREHGSDSFTWEDVKKDKPGKRHSKKYQLSALQRRGDWQDQFFAAVPDRHKAAVAILQLTGCRPSELVNGIQSKLVNRQLVVVISGSKVTDQSGQASRLLVIDPDSKAGQFLITAIPESGCLTISVSNQKSFAEAIASAGKKAFPRLKGRISPYVFRHAFSSDLKSAGVLPDQIACAMGHRVTRTQERYGRSSHGRGATNLVAAHASSGIRDTRRDPRRLSPAPLPPTFPALVF